MTVLPDAPRATDPDILALREEFGNSPESLLDALRALKQRRGSLDRETLRELARVYDVPAERVAGIVSFYSLLSTGGRDETTLRVCDGIACWMAGAGRIRNELESTFSGLQIERNSCLGLCDRAPAAICGGRQFGPISGSSDPRDGSEWTAGLPPLRAGETRFALRRATSGKGAAFERARVPALSPEHIFEMLDAADLRGMGGAGFPAAKKWRWAAAAEGIEKFVVCNADESEPLAFKDRVLIDADPRRILEGLRIAGHAIGARTGIIYIRGEYEPQAQRLEQAIADAEAEGWLGCAPNERGISFRVSVHRGAGAYICGEETALLESLEGKRGEPRARPPYPIQTGFRGQPTLVSNVETLAMAAAICDYGLDEFVALGTHGSPGTKLYAVLGRVQNPGLFEAPRGLTLRQIIEDFGGGMRDGNRFAFALVGGAAGTFADASRLDHRLDFGHADDILPMGTGAVLVADESVSILAALREVLHFFESESCGKCTPCRIGTGETRFILDRILARQGNDRDLQRLESLSRTLTLSLCGLGTSVPLPIASALRHFRPDFESLIGEKG